MDIAIHWGLLRHLRKEIDFNPLITLFAILFDSIILIAFVALKMKSDPLVPAVSALGILVVILAERLFMRTHTDDEGEMHMEMDHDT